MKCNILRYLYMVIYNRVTQNSSMQSLVKINKEMEKCVMDVGAEKEVIRTIYHKNVMEFFDAIGLTEEIVGGGIQCAVCGQIITPENFKVVTRRSGKLLFCCDNESCIHTLASFE